MSSRSRTFKKCEIAEGSHIGFIQRLAQGEGKNSLIDRKEQFPLLPSPKTREKRAAQVFPHLNGSNRNERMRFDMAIVSPITTARFWSKVAVKVSNSDCWEWSGSLGSNGYGTFKVGKWTVGAHRVAFALANGHFPKKGLVVRHKCDNPTGSGNVVTIQ